MTVAELCRALAQCDQEALVILSSDAEGNSYSPLAAWWPGVYRADTAWAGEAGVAEELAGVPAVMMVPTR